MNRHANGPMTHERAQQLLPWLPGCTLDDAEFAAVQEHVDMCPQCQADVEWHARLRAAVPPADPAFSADRAFASLLPRLGPQEQRLSVLEKWRQAPPANGAWLRWTALGQCAVIAALAVALARPGADAGDYHALGPTPTVQGSVVLVFKPDTTEQEMRRVLQASGARVVDGPTVAGAWVLAPPDGQEAGALSRLRAEPAVELAQPLGAGSAP